MAAALGVESTGQTLQVLQQQEGQPGFFCPVSFQHPHCHLDSSLQQPAPMAVGEALREVLIPCLGLWQVPSCSTTGEMLHTSLKLSAER